MIQTSSRILADHATDTVIDEGTAVDQVIDLAPQGLRER